MLDKPLSDLDAWVAYLSQAPIPVLKRTAAALAELREKEDSVTGRHVAGVILQDPLMTLKVLAYIEATRRQRQTADITTIDRAVMMMGVTPFFQKFAELPLVENTLANKPQALLGLLKVMARARQASLYARDWAVFRHDLDVEEIVVAALLRDTSEILLWCFAPALMIQVRMLQDANRSLRSAAAQKAVLGVSLRELQMAVAKAWHLPGLLLSLMDHKLEEDPRVRNVALAVDLARHAQRGWSDAALPDDYAAIGKLLNINREALMERISRVAQNPMPPEALASAAETADVLPLSARN